ncbi:OmdA domain containing protein [Lichenibacterium minor]|uniref:OmdA domain containing protein n=1 Tax=Lichenibacterium minor TaxID=2316528 RepID=A0A4Q2U5M1_9HYPH|nr:OmdA domain containing protein [Lichenibacterium minor]RYC30106.1 OmdA domain containing protein [Lichenibacterium minor]
MGVEMDGSDPAAPAATKGGLPIVGFVDAPAFAAWLPGRDKTAAGAWLRFAKKGSGASKLSHREAIDCALCEGWIDGQAAPWDERFFLVRFTSRRPRGNGSQVNRVRVTESTAEGRMRPRGLREADAARADGRWDRAYPSSSNATVPDDLRVALEGGPAAAARFDGLNRSER